LVFLTVAALDLWLTAGAAMAASLTGQIRDGSGAPLADAVVTARPAGGRLAPPVDLRPVRMELDQKGREFIPHVLPVRVGTPVFFPNSDEIQHHVYSFSKAKRFEIKLYRGTPARPEVFDQPGVVAVGCNIHDWMLGYVYVTDAPYFARTDGQGRWELTLPEGEYRLALWHPDAESAAESSASARAADRADPIQHTLVLKPRRQSGKPPLNLQQQNYSGDF
jgi:plastocyanin